MKVKTISLPEDLHREIMKLRLQKESKNTAELIKELLFEYRERKFLEASRLFRVKLKEKNISLAQLLKQSRKIREEIADEWYPDKN